MSNASYSRPQETQFLDGKSKGGIAFTLRRVRSFWTRLDPRSWNVYWNGQRAVADENAARSPAARSALQSALHHEHGRRVDRPLVRGLLRTAAASVLLALIGCTGAALPLARAPECAWHFLIPCDTNDTVHEPGAATCSADRFTLDDGWVQIDMLRDGAFTFGACKGKAGLVGGDARFWQATIDGECGLSGTLTVNDL